MHGALLNQLNAALVGVQKRSRYATKIKQLQYQQQQQQLQKQQQGDSPHLLKNRFSQEAREAWIR